MYVVLSLGSNIGSKRENILKAYEELEKENIRIIKKSDFLENKAYGVEEQDDFVNSVILAKNSYSPQELLKKIKKIEKKVGRYETFRWGPRVIDIDIIFFDNIFYMSENLIIPHKDYKNRSFVIEPLEEIKSFIVENNIDIMV